MKAPVHTVHMDSTLQTAYERLRDHGISCLAVVDDSEQLVGVISRSDLLRIGRYEAGAPSHGEAWARLLRLPARSVGESMTRDVLCVRPDDAIAAACQRMLRRQVHRVFVIEGQDDNASRQCAVGVLSTRDIMETVRDLRLATPIEAVMSRPVFTVAATDPVSLAAAKLDQARISGLVVVDEEWPIGLFTQKEALRVRDLPGDTAVEEVMNPAFVCMPPQTRVFRAAEQAAAMSVRRIIVSQQRDMAGIVSGLDFVRVASDPSA